jgi:hypothetical protein
MTFMRDGGLAMWLTLLFFVVAAIVALIARNDSRGWRIAAIGSVAVIASGLAGFATGLYKTVEFISSVELERRTEVLGLGLSESVNNILFGGVLAFVLAVVALALAARRPAKIVA